MTEPAPPGDLGGDGDDRVIVVVVRSGGLLGRSKRWVAEPEASHTERWVTLIERCPWDQRTDATGGADRYMWSIHATLPGERREQEVPDAALDGPWRDLVEAVREAPGSRVPAEPSPQPGASPEPPATNSRS